MEQAGIRELKQNASAVVAAAANGEPIIITDRGRPVAQLSRIADSALDRLRAAGRVREASKRLADLPDPDLDPLPGPPLSATLSAMRDEERY
jgi:prevent-host-death family protein